MTSKRMRTLESSRQVGNFIKHIKGKKNKAVDALSKRVHEMHVATISMCGTDLKDRILEVITIPTLCTS
jgi:hypothetical protein